MIKVNGKSIKLNKYPDGTFLLKDLPMDKYEAAIEWYFESMEELSAIIYIAKHFWSHRLMPKLYMPYIPDARMDRTKSDDEVFTLKYFAQTINDLHFSKVIVLDPHSDVAAALFNNISVQNPKRTIENVVRRIVSSNLMMFYPDSGAMKRYSSMVHIPYAFGIKNRDWKTGEIKGLDLSGEVSRLPGKDILIVDDICSRGGTFYHSAKKLKEAGVDNIYLYITHCENTIYDGELLKDNGLIKKVYTTDTILTNFNSPKIELVERFRREDV